MLQYIVHVRRYKPHIARARFCTHHHLHIASFLLQMLERLHVLVSICNVEQVQLLFTKKDALKIPLPWGLQGDHFDIRDEYHAMKDTSSSSRARASKKANVEAFASKMEEALKHPAIILLANFHNPKSLVHFKTLKGSSLVTPSSSFLVFACVASPLRFCVCRWNAEGGAKPTCPYMEQSLS